MPISKKLQLDDSQIQEILRTEWNCRIATVGPGSRINVTPMWFGWAGGRIYIYGRGQKVVNIRRQPDCTIIVDRNEKFPELQAIMMQGQGHILESADAETADPHLAEVRIHMGLKYNGGHGQAALDEPPPNSATVRGRNGRWIVFVPDRQVTWDNFKLKNLQ